MLFRSLLCSQVFIVPYPQWHSAEEVKTAFANGGDLPGYSQGLQSGCLIHDRLLGMEAKGNQVRPCTGHDPFGGLEPGMVMNRRQANYPCCQIAGWKPRVVLKKVVGVEVGIDQHGSRIAEAWAPYKRLSQADSSPEQAANLLKPLSTVRWTWLILLAFRLE